MVYSIESAPIGGYILGSHDNTMEIFTQSDKTLLQGPPWYLGEQDDATW